jgi:hypothetical protein
MLSKEKLIRFSESSWNQQADHWPGQEFPGKKIKTILAKTVPQKIPETV